MPSDAPHHDTPPAPPERLVEATAQAAATRMREHMATGDTTAAFVRGDPDAAVLAWRGKVTEALIMLSRDTGEVRGLLLAAQERAEKRERRMWRIVDRTGGALAHTCGEIGRFFKEASLLRIVAVTGPVAVALVAICGGAGSIYAIGDVMRPYVRHYLGVEFVQQQLEEVAETAEESDGVTETPSP